MNESAKRQLAQTGIFSFCSSRFFQLLEKRIGRRACARR